MGLFDDLKDLKNVLVDVTGLDPFPEGKKSPGWILSRRERNLRWISEGN